MALTTKTLEVPFQTGLAQKTDQEWLEPGAASVAQNLVKLKSGSLQKRRGYTAISNSALATPNPFTTSLTVPLVTGKRLATQAGAPILIASDQWTDAAWNVIENLGRPGFIDRMPEVYANPYEIVGSNSSGSSALTIGSVFEMDVAVTNGYELMVWSDPSGNGSCWVYLREAATFRAMLPVQQLFIGSFPGAGSGNIGIVKVIAVGNKFLITLSRATTDNNLWATTIDTTNLIGGFSASTRINTAANDSVNNVTAAVPNPYDVCPVIGDTAKFGLIYEATRAGVRTIRIVIYTLAGFVVVSDTAIDATDATWTADNGISAAASQLTALALRVDANNSDAAYAYSWRSTAPLLRVSTGIRNYPAMTNQATPVNLMGTILGSMTTTDNAVAIVTMERNGNISGNITYTVRFSPGSAVLDQGATQLPYVASYQAFNNAGAMTIASVSPRVTYGCSLWSRDQTQNSISYFVAYVPSTTQGSFFVFADDFWLDNNTGFGVTAIMPARPVAHIAPRLANPLVPTVATPLQSRVATHIAANAALGAKVFDVLFPTAANAQSVVPARVSLDFSSTLQYQATELGPDAIFASGVPSACDGQCVFELGFPYYPVIVSVTMAGGAGSLSAGSYAYIAVFEFTDSKGLKHRSARSVPFRATAAALNTATLKITQIGFTSKNKSPQTTTTVGLGPLGLIQPFFQRPGVVIKLYRTQAGGSIYTNVLANDSPIAVCYGGTVTQTITVTDGASDASIASNVLVYGDGSDGTTPGNLLDNMCGPAFQAVTVHQNRIFGVDGPRIWPSKVFTFGEGAGFNEATAFSVDDGPGNVLALASLDDKLVIFKSDRVLYMTGLGPADNGTQNDWAPPQRVASDTGIIDWRSVVTTPEGIYFMSPLGRRLLTRDLQVRPVTQFDDLDVTDPVITSALLHPSDGRVIWTANTDDSTTPRVGVIEQYDYVTGGWTTSVNNDNLGHTTRGFVSGAIATALVSSGPPAVIKTVASLLRDDGTIIRENPVGGTSLDGGLFFAYTWTSPWLKSDGIVGFSCWRTVRLMLRQLDPARITVTIAYDYPGSPLASTVRTFTAAQIQGGTVPGLIEIRPVNDRAAAMQITIADAGDTGTTTGAGFVLVGLRVDYDVESGGYRASPTQRG